MGFWVRPDFNDLLSKLSDDIANAADPEDFLNRARMYMAIELGFVILQKAEYEKCSEYWESLK